MTPEELDYNANKAKRLVEDKLQGGNPTVLDRQKRNVLLPSQGGILPSTDRETMWYVHIGCLLTSQQKSSRGSAVYQFMHEPDFLLPYEKCRQELQRGKLSAFVRRTLKDYGGIRFVEEKIPSAVEYNLHSLEQDRGTRWNRLIQKGKQLLKQRILAPVAGHYQLEEEISDYIDDYLKGFGSKQARNFWQWLGLTRYVSVLDSRVKKWCTQNLKGSWELYNLNRKQDYNSMAKALRKICGKAKVLPCMFDAAAFVAEESDDQGKTNELYSFCRGDETDEWDEVVKQH
jgi:hypothetical protein